MTRLPKKFVKSASSSPLEPSTIILSVIARIRRVNNGPIYVSYYDITSCNCLLYSNPCRDILRSNLPIFIKDSIIACSLILEGSRRIRLHSIAHGKRPLAYISGGGAIAERKMLRSFNISPSLDSMGLAKSAPQTGCRLWPILQDSACALGSRVIAAQILCGSLDCKRTAPVPSIHGAAH